MEMTKQWADMFWGSWLDGFGWDKAWLVHVLYYGADWQGPVYPPKIMHIVQVFEKYLT
jgi:hypothetical protein